MQRPKDTSLRGNTSYDVSIVKISPLVRPVRVTKKLKKDKEPEQWQTGYSPKPPMLSHRDVVLHGG